MRAPGAALLLLAVLALLVVAPILVLLGQALLVAGPDGVPRPGITHFELAFARTPVAELLGNSLVFASGSAVVALAVGTALAWIAERTDAPGRGLLFLLSLLPLVFPGVLFNLAWILLASPRIGLLNRLATEALGAPSAPLDVFSMAGMIWVDGLHAAPIAFLMMSAAFRSMDPALEEAATMAGARPLQVVRRIVLPVLAPAWRGALLVLFLHALESIESPAFLGLPAGIEVFTSAILEAVKDDAGALGPASALSTLLLLITVVSLWMLRRVGGGAERYAMPAPNVESARRLRLGRWRAPVAALVGAWFVLSTLLPLAALVWSSLHPFGLPGMTGAGAGPGLDEYHKLAGYPQVGRAALNSLWLAALAATCVMALAAPVAWLALRGRNRLERSLEVVSSLSLAYPGIIVGVGIMLVSLALGGWIYGTVWILLVAYVTRCLPVGVRYAVASIARVPPVLEDAAAVAGAGSVTAIRRITLPLAAPGLLVGWSYVALVSFRELSASLLLYSPGSEVIGVVLWDMLEAGQYGAASAVGVLFVIALGLAMAVFRWLLGRWSRTGA